MGIQMRWANGPITSDRRGMKANSNPKIVSSIRGVGQAWESFQVNTSCCLSLSESVRAVYATQKNALASPAHLRLSSSALSSLAVRHAGWPCWPAYLDLRSATFEACLRDLGNLEDEPLHNMDESRKKGAIRGHKP